MTKTRFLWTLCSVIVVAPAAARADAADQFARFEAGVLVIEDRCDDYYSLTDATMGNHLTPEEYQRAQAQIETLRPKMAKTLEPMSCQEAAEAVAEMGGMPYLKVWERR